MEVYVNINGVLRNWIQKFEHQYKTHFLESDIEDTQQKLNEDGETIIILDEEPQHTYEIIHPIQNDEIEKCFSFQSKEEYEYFTFMEFPLEIFGYAGLSYSTAISDLNKLMYNNSEINFTVVGVDELGKSKSSTLFFLSKNGFLGNNIKFIKNENIDTEWNKCDIWVTDDEHIINSCPLNKKVIKFNTIYNSHFSNKNEINNLINIDLTC